jgi:hypothetical protein
MRLLLATRLVRALSLTTLGLIAGAACAAAPRPAASASAPPRSCMTGAGDACLRGEICLEHRGGASKAPGGTCTKIAEACRGAASCACMGSVCASPAECSMAGPAHLVCACRTCP